MTDIATARPASTVVLLRDSDNGMETLMLRRNKALQFAGGLWVFPGGAVDQADTVYANGDAELAARYAAVREAQEEVGIAPALQDLCLLSHWTTPVVEPRRFSTWIYAAPIVTSDEVLIDGSEIHEARWLPIAEVLQANEAGELAMLPPTYITLRDLLRFANTEALTAAQEQRQPPQVLPVFASDPDQVIVMFEGDAGYASADCKLPGARHRACYQGGRWEYVYCDVAAAYPSYIGATVL